MSFRKNIKKTGTNDIPINPAKMRVFGASAGTTATASKPPTSLLTGPSHSGKSVSVASTVATNDSPSKKRNFDVFQGNDHEGQYDGVHDGEDDQAEFKKLNKELILDDKDSDDEDSAAKKQKIDTGAAIVVKSGNSLKDGSDFISFDFSDSEDEANDDDSSDDDGDVFSVGDNTTDLTNDRPVVNSSTPWIKQHDHSAQKEIADWLNLEIQDFIAYISPSKDEIETRNRVVRTLKEAIQDFWRDCEVHVFGSYATDLYLPGSDIDMVVVSPDRSYDSRNYLYSLSTFLKREGLAIKVEVIAKAKVPIIKFTEPSSNIHIDVSFERTNGIDAARTINQWLDETPGLRELVLIVKQFLSTRKLNDVHLGGLGGYSTICMVYSFLKLHPRLSTCHISPLENLGVLLIEFFELYGRNFGYDNVAICVAEDGVCYLKKKYYPELQNRNPFQLAIQDPSDPSNNISRGSYNIADIKKAFSGAFSLLVNSCYDLNKADFKERLGKSILGNVLKYKGKDRDFKDERGLVENEHLVRYDQDVRIIRPQIVYEGHQTEDEEDQTRDEDRGTVDQFMGINENDDEEDEQVTREPRENGVDKETRREMWASKGNALP
ncbi:hypothetical protein WICPIJ_007967 [Wickerhamomyces pijperi]|uniref:polynucleotide adenylyltransferase n=1 Tax=Wickerhamomyces pijperi TaxID=599730 RepID=A0A9P8PZ67_WICPI|nr:hypothetical protein WICPIJ_007967 [Wickerhamomyces pijperi]